MVVINLFYIVSVSNIIAYNLYTCTVFTHAAYISRVPCPIPRPPLTLNNATSACSSAILWSEAARRCLKINKQIILLSIIQRRKITAIKP